MSDWPLSDELVMVRDTARRFMRQDVKPAEDQVEHDAIHLPDHLLLPLQQKAKDLGIWCIRSPAEYGGAGLSLLGQAVVAEETARCRMGAYIPACGAIGFDVPNTVFEWGTPYQIEKYAKPGVIEGRKVFTAVTEPTGGSDPARSIRTRAVRQGDDYVLNGTKMWISGIQHATWGMVFARTGDQGDRGGISAFILELDTPGVSTRRIPVLRAYSPYEITLQDVKIPVKNLLGEEGKGFQVFSKWTTEGRIPYAAGTLGVAQEALEMAIEWVRHRETFKTKLADKQAIQWMVADSEMELQAARMLVYKAAMVHETGGDLRYWSSMAKVTATETAHRVVDRCVQMFGALGVAEEMPLERWFRELRVKRVGEGPSEVQRMVVARSLLKTRSTVDAG
ncbi:acyl-CoA dehydrogenase [Silicimonas algicola]|uniref:3-sulfinopropanoyl-CoA desulfinase n=1 Tax=Silicimonas algicola TaxID=1826607 RepID=A0A316G155_9RHOB|nr:acyl-CoA dehydrogenase family protein [Silicimonas algicola]AZQ68284.1 acyl-CoA dehydrogenase [Silicimonas algicola]PWK54579.1 alkylation response protein AidB-like acyl-CoA dehydrogenase [Silicimonas algicola]